MWNVPHQRSPLGYLFWRWIFRNNGKRAADLDGFFWGPSRGMNDYDSLATNYKGSNVKPDKQYSILPTVLKMVGDCTGKTVIDIGCGSGFFTVPLAELGASRVWGIDNSRAQLTLALQVSQHPAITYAASDVFTDDMTPADIMVAPFVANYARTLPILRYFFEKLRHWLREGGKVVFVVDLPNGKSLKRFGAVKTIVGRRADEATIQIDLFNGEKNICTLECRYYTPETIVSLLREAGFKNICWHTPIVSKEGVSAMEPGFWDGYTEDPELGYLTVEK